MIKLISIDNGVMWLDFNGEVYGIVNAFKVLDCDGLVYHDKSVYDIFEKSSSFINDFSKGTNELLLSSDQIAIIDNLSFTVK